MDDLHEKLANLVRLAKRPGTPHEGEAARLAAIRLCEKYNLNCEFVPGSTATDSIGFTNTNPTSATDDAVFYQWIKSLASYGWSIYECLDTKIGRQIKFRKPGYNSELRITQRAKGGGKDFEAEHIKHPDPVDGMDRSFCIFITISLKELMRHIGHTRDVA